MRRTEQPNIPAAQAVLDARAAFMGSAGASPAVPGVLAGDTASREMFHRKHAASTSGVSGEAPETAREARALPTANAASKRG